MDLKEKLELLRQRARGSMGGRRTLVAAMTDNGQELRPLPAPEVPVPSGSVIDCRGCGKLGFDDTFYRDPAKNEMLCANCAVARVVTQERQHADGNYRYYEVRLQTQYDAIRRHLTEIHALRNPYPKRVEVIDSDDFSEP